ncbi:hypothetical protein JCM5353_007986 [Sporobolomyces roseus]
MIRADLVLLQIDRLSSLPPELLLSIFDFAYDPSSPLLEPLSKRLLPHVRRNLYRRIHLSSLASFAKLFNLVKGQAELGELVEDLDTSDVFYYHESYEALGEINDILPVFPRLVNAKLGNIRPINEAVLLQQSSLRSLSFEIETPTTDELVRLYQLNLHTLEINFRSTAIPNTDCFYNLSSLRKLTLVHRTTASEAQPEEIVWNTDLAEIVDFCPNLTHLKLVEPYYPEFTDVLENLPRLAESLTHLELESPASLQEEDIASDFTLTHFPNLVYLSLCDNSTSLSLPTYLRHLSDLVTLRLGPWSHHPLTNHAEFISLFQGPTKLPALKRLILDCFGGRAGRRIRKGDEVGSDIEGEMARDGWEEPYLHKVQVPALFEACRISRIAVEGKGATVLEDLADYNREHGNRAALRCVQIKSLDPLDSLGGAFRSDHISDFILDPTSPRLVTYGLHKSRDWYYFRLE